MSLRDFLMQQQDTLNLEFESPTDFNPNTLRSTLEQYDSDTIDPVDNFSGTSVDIGETLKVNDLMRPEYADKIRKYMTFRFGAKYKNRKIFDNNKMADDFVNHMRWFNTNTISTSGEIMKINRATEEDKVMAGEAYKIYDKLGNVFVNDGIRGAISGVKDYILSAAVDPTNYIGAATGGIARATAMGTTVAARKVMMKSIQEATKKALREKGTKKAARAAGKEAARVTAKNLSEQIVRSKAGQQVISKAMQNEQRSFIKNAERTARKKLINETKNTAAKRTILRQTLPADATASFLNDYLVQRAYIDTKARDKYSAFQGGLAIAAGGIGAGMQFGFQSRAGKSGLADAGAATAAKERKNSVSSLVKISQSKGSLDSLVKELKKQVINHSKSWSEKVSAGKEMGANRLDNELVSKIILGEDGKGKAGGLAYTYAKKIGLPLGKDDKVSEILTSIVDLIPKKDLDQMNNALKGQAITMGDTVKISTNIGDLLAGKASSDGQGLALWSTARQAINGAVLLGQDSLDDLVKNSDVVADQIAKLKGSKRGASYIQNIWRRLLVSSPATTAVNVLGFGQYNIGMTIVDLFSSGQHALAGYGLKMTGRAKQGDELLRKARVYRDIQAQKMSNFLDPYATFDAFKEVISRDPKASKLIFDTIAGSGIERGAKKYGFDPQGKFYKNAETAVDAVNMLTGVRMQDTYTKSQMFMTELDKALRLKTGSTFAEVARKGDLDVIDGDTIATAVDTTLRSVFSKDYTIPEAGGMLSDWAAIVERISRTPGLGVVLPFGRFLNSLVANAYQWGPLPLVGITGRILKGSVSSTGKGFAKTAGEELTTNQAFNRALVGTTILGTLMQYDAEKKADGDILGTHDISMGGETLDVKLVAPLSLMMTVAKYLNYKLSFGARKDETMPQEILIELAEQFGTANLSRDFQFGTDMRAIIDVLTNDDPNAQRVSYQLLGKKVGNVGAGFTRPLDFVNQAVGAIIDSEAVKDTRLAENAAAVATQRASRYTDNIIELFSGIIDNVTGAEESPIIDKYITGKELSVATRESKVYPSGNFLAKMIGIKIKPEDTDTEQLYNVTSMQTFKANFRTDDPLYDQYATKLLRPILDVQSERLLESNKFMNSSLDEKRKAVKGALNDAKRKIRKYISTSYSLDDEGNSGFTLDMKRKAKSMDAGTRKEALSAMEELEYETDINEMSAKELQYFLMFSEYYKEGAKMLELRVLN